MTAEVFSLPIKVLCLFDYWTRESGVTRKHSAAVVVRVRCSWEIDRAFRTAMLAERFSYAGKGYELTGIVPEHGREGHW